MADRWRYAHVREILTVYRWARAELTAGRTVHLAWNGPTLDAEGYRRWFRRGLDHRINLKMGPYPTWRKLDDDYQRNLERDCRAIRDTVRHRAALHQLSTPELRRRFGHLLTEWLRN